MTPEECASMSWHNYLRGVEMIRQLVAAEREACARQAESMTVAELLFGMSGEARQVVAARERIAAAIRARSNQ